MNASLFMQLFTIGEVVIIVLLVTILIRLGGFMRKAAANDVTKK